MHKRLRSSPLVLSIAAAVVVVIVTVAPGVMIGVRSAARQTNALVGRGRNPAYWPFDSDSPWNRPIGEWAKFERIQVTGFKPQGARLLTQDTVLVARPRDPSVKVVVRGKPGVAARIRLPAHVELQPDKNGSCILIDSSHSYALEVTSPQIHDKGELHVSRLYRTNLRGMGVYPQRHGYRAYGGSALGGLIRRGELNAGIRHALAVSVRRALINPEPQGGKPYVWPASDAEPGWDDKRSGYRGDGNLFLGTLLAIPPDVSLSTLGVGDRGPAYQIARALQNYGAYIVDTGNDTIAFFAETGAADDLPPDLGDQLDRIVAQLKVVRNSAPNHVGGGGDPARGVPLAPPLLRVEAFRP